MRSTTLYHKHGKRGKIINEHLYDHIQKSVETRHESRKVNLSLYRREVEV
jgi:hypothetical protein